MTRLGATIGLAYALAVIVVFLSVVAIWPRLSVPLPSLSVVKPSLPVTTTPTAPATATVPPPSVTERPNRPTERPTPTAKPTKPPPKPTKPPPTDPPLLAIRGEATFYCLAPLSPCTSGFPAVGLYAAAGAELRTALGDWRGRKVTVWYGSTHVTVTLIDTCSCDVDLYAAAFVLLAPLELGVLDVEIRW